MPPKKASAGSKEQEDLPGDDNIVITILQQDVQFLREEFTQFKDLLLSLQRDQNTTPAPTIGTPKRELSPVNLPQPVTNKDPTVPLPPEFSGKLSEFENFMVQCDLAFTLCPNTYNCDERKVLLVISRLRGTPLNWARDISKNKVHPLRHNYQAFVEALTNLYGTRTYLEQFENKLLRLRQTNSVAPFAAEFQSLAETLGMDEKTKCMLFYDKLDQKIKDTIVPVGRAFPLNALVNQAIAIDQHHRQRELEIKNNSSESPKISNSYNSNSKSSFPPSQNSSGGPHPSYHRPPLTQAEKQRRKDNNLCGYCGEGKHRTADCPRLKPKNSTDSISNLHYSYDQNSEPQIPFMLFTPPPPTTSTDNPTSSIDNPTTSIDNPTSSTDNPTSSTDNPITSIDNPTTSFASPVETPKHVNKPPRPLYTPKPILKPPQARFPTHIH